MGGPENQVMRQSRNNAPNPSTELPSECLTGPAALCGIDTTHPGLWAWPLDCTAVLVTLLPPLVFYILFSAQQPEWSLKSATHIISLFLWLLLPCG